MSMDVVQVTITSYRPTIHLNILSGAVTIHNSNNSYSVIAGAGEDVLLPDIKFTDSDGSVHYIPSCTNITATQCTGTIEKMDMRLIHTGLLTPNTLEPVVHNTGVNLGAIDVDLKLTDLNGQPVFVNQFLPDPDNPLNVALIEHGNDSATDYLLRIIYKKS